MAETAIAIDRHRQLALADTEASNRPCVQLASACAALLTSSGHSAVQNCDSQL